MTMKIRMTMGMTMKIRMTMGMTMKIRMMMGMTMKIRMTMGMGMMIRIRMKYLKEYGEHGRYTGGASPAGARRAQTQPGVQSTDSI